MVEVLELVFLEDAAGRRVGVKVISEVGAFRSGGLEDGEIAGEVFDKAAEALELAMDVDHQLVLRFNIAESFCFETVCNNAGAAVGVAAGDTDCGIVQDFLGVVGGCSRGNEHRTVENGSSIGEIYGEADQTLFGGGCGGGGYIPSSGVELEEACVANAGGGFGSRVMEAGVKEGAYETPW